MSAGLSVVVVDEPNLNPQCLLELIVRGQTVAGEPAGFNVKEHHVTGAALHLRGGDAFNLSDGIRADECECPLTLGAFVDLQVLKFLQTV